MGLYLKTKHKNRHRALAQHTSGLKLKSQLHKIATFFLKRSTLQISPCDAAGRLAFREHLLKDGPV